MPWCSVGPLLFYGADAKLFALNIETLQQQKVCDFGPCTRLVVHNGSQVVSVVSGEGDTWQTYDYVEKAVTQVPRSCVVVANVDQNNPGTLEVSSVGKITLDEENFSKAGTMVENGVLYVSSQNGSFYEIDINTYFEEES